MEAVNLIELTFQVDGSRLSASAATKVASVYDVNGDSAVDLADLSLAFYYYQSRSGGANWASAQAADVNSDGVVDMLDLVAIYANFIA
jgi:hypothetical protein